MLVCGTAVRCKGLRGGLHSVLRDNSIKSLWSKKDGKIERWIKKDGLLLAIIIGSEIREMSKRMKETSAFPLMKILLTFSLHLKQISKNRSESLVNVVNGDLPSCQ